MCKRGDIYNVDFGKDIGTSKQCGVRPAVIISNNRANQHSPVITVVPLTSKTKKKRFLPTHVFIPYSAEFGLNRSSIVLAEQIETIDKDRLLEKKGTIKSDLVMKKITKAIQIQIGVYEEYN